jgi:hypothetical protein
MKKKIQFIIRFRKHLKFLRREIHLVGSKIHHLTIDIYISQKNTPEKSKSMQQSLTMLKKQHSKRLRRYELLTFFKSAS